MPNGLSGYVPYTKSDFIALLRMFPLDTVVGVTYDIKHYQETGERLPARPMTAEMMLAAVEAVSPDNVPIAEQDHSSFLIRLDGMMRDPNNWVSVSADSPLYPLFRARRKGIGERP